MDYTVFLLAIILLQRAVQANNPTNLDVDNPPLYLTPYIENGQITRAKTLSLITHDVIPRSYAGLITVDKQRGNHLFFWFFPAINLDPHSPLMVWLNGGPGISSMIGIFYENGPMRLGLNENNDLIFERWNKTWAEKFNMLYIDQPVGVGYSYTEDEQRGYRITQDGYSKDLYVFIEQFYVMFPEFMNRDLYIGGQSYGGKYVPAFAYHLHTEIRANRSTIPLKGIYLGGPLFDPEKQCEKAADLYEVLGVIGHKQAVEFKSEFDAFVELGNYTNYKTYEFFNVIFPKVDIREKDNYLTLRGAYYYEVQVMMRTKAMRELVHAGNLSYVSESDPVYLKLNQDFMVGVTAKLAVLMDNYKVLIYNGDFDLLVSSAMVDAGVMAMGWSLQAEYNASLRQIWGASANPKGFYTKSGQFCRVVIRAGGHRIPHDQPEVSRDMMEQFVRFGCVQT